MQLAPLAMRDEWTQGRRYPEAVHPYRSEFRRDRDRIIHAKAFRRLENKMQVFDPDYSDHFRNRLTHTIEVSQITRTISDALMLNTDFSEVLALSHDVGHPPFSHTGEEVLNLIMQDYGSGFDHNLHGLRIVEYFEEKYAAFPGLNLTFEVREGIVKHSRDYACGGQTYVDISEYRLEEKPPLEAQLIDLADEIAYNSADLDDGFHSGLLSFSQIVAEVGLFRELYEEVKTLYPQAPIKLLFSETIRSLIDTLTTDLIENSCRELQKHSITSLEEVRRSPGRLIGFSPGMFNKNQELKQFLRQSLYNHEVLRAGRKRAQAQLEKLFRYYLRKPQGLPGSHFLRVSELPLHQVVCDYIAGMTDKYVESRCRQIFGDDEFV